ncbi:MAG: hypothetical protein JHC74_14625 [Thermoleophilia bacterium]|nr:hypothetical protein [Thermoleophilia bacterium]
MTPRVPGAVLLVAGAATAVVPGFTWFTGPPPATPTHASGFAGAGQLWLLPLLGVLIALAGAGFISARPGAGRAVARWAGPLSLAAGLIAAALAVWAASDPVVTLRVTTDGLTETVPVAVTLEPAAFAAPVIAGLAAVIGAVATRVGWRR